MAREHPESVKRLSVERGDLERAATLHALTLHARRMKPRGPHLFLHEPLASSSSQPISPSGTFTVNVLMFGR